MPRIPAYLAPKSPSGGTGSDCQTATLLASAESEWSEPNYDRLLAAAREQASPPQDKPGEPCCPHCADDVRANEGRLQAKSDAGGVGDQHEREADRFAERVGADPLPRRMDGVEAISPAGGTAGMSDALSRHALDTIRSGSGQRLDPGIRGDMEQRFGCSFAEVRVHTRPNVARSVRSIRARAYTIGNDIAFDRYAPGTAEGRQLLAHELTHVVQQSRGSGGVVQRNGTDDLADLMAGDLDKYVASHPEPYAYILSFLGSIDPEIRDNVAADFSELQSNVALRRFASATLGRKMLDVLTGAMITGDVTEFEAVQAERILLAQRGFLSMDAFSERADRIAALRHEAAPAMNSDAYVTQLATDLRVYVGGNLFSRVSDAFDDIPSSIEDNVAGEILEPLSDQRLTEIAGVPSGVAMLDILYEAMITGHVTAFEALQSERILLAKSRTEATSDQDYMTQAARIAKLRDKAEDDSLADLAVDESAHELAEGMKEVIADKGFIAVKIGLNMVSSDDRDNVASALIELLPPHQLEQVAADPVGRALLDLCYAEIITGSVSDFERLQTKRILEAKAATRDESGADPLQEFAEEQVYTLPLKMQKTFSSSYAIFDASLESDGRVKVSYDDEIHFWEADMFKADREPPKMPPYRQASTGFFLKPDQLVLLKLYDQGGQTIPVQAIELIDYANQAMHESVNVGFSAFEKGLFLGYGGLAALSDEGVAATAARVEAGEASIAGLRVAQGVLWADRVSMALPLISFVVNENRDWILAKFPDAGPILLTVLDQADRIATYYGYGRMGVDAARYLHGKLEGALAKWQEEKAAGSFSSSQHHAVEEIEANLKAMQEDLAKSEAAAAAEAVQHVEQHPELTSNAPPGERTAKVGEHEVVEVKEPDGGIHCEFHSDVVLTPCPAPWIKDQPQPAAEAGEPGQAPPEKMPPENAPDQTPAAAPPNPAAGIPEPVARRLAEINRELEQNTQRMYKAEEERIAAKGRADKAAAEVVTAEETVRDNLRAKRERNRATETKRQDEIKELQRKNNALRDEARDISPPPAPPANASSERWGEYLTELEGPPPADMVDPHAHHIVFQTGNGAEQRVLVAEGQKILRSVGIDPIYGRENLVWAPMRVVEQHAIGPLKRVVDELKMAQRTGLGRDAIVDILIRNGKLASVRK